jgi:methionyl-tRNA synthetase
MVSEKAKEEAASQMKETFYVTTPIYYVNDLPHIGHAYTTIAADILARYHKLCGENIFFLTGTDEHGQKVEKAARERGLTPKTHCDAMVENYKRIWETFDIRNDAFIRTTDPCHISVVQALLQDLFKKGEIEKRSYSGWYCVPDERFWTEKEVDEGSCPDCKRPVERISEENYFFLMSRYGDRIVRHIEENPGFILPETRRNEVLGFLKSNPLGDLCISRPKRRLSWGIPLPFDEDYVTYVWFDALLNYFSATSYLAPPVGFSQYSGRNVSDWWPADLHLIGKDILTTHAVYWSAMLMALGMPLPQRIFAHGWWTVEGKKMSKSLGNVVDPIQVVQEYGLDAFRYFLFREVPFGLDGDFSGHSMLQRYNTDLANDLGNLVSRSLTMIVKYRGGSIPGPIPEKDRDGLELKVKSWFGDDSFLREYDRHLRNVEFHNALSRLWQFIHEVNEFVQHAEPWKEKDEEILSNVLYTVAESLRIIAPLLFPFMPAAAEKIWEQLGVGRAVAEARVQDEVAWGRLMPGVKTAKGEAMFPRKEKPKQEHAPSKLS